MSFNPFSALTSKIFGGALIVALLWGAAMLVRGNQWRATARKADATLALVKPAQDLALAKARQAIADTEARYKDHANEADANHAAAIADARTDADRYIAAHRVPACPASAPRGSPAPAQGGSASIPAILPTSTVVDEADVQACSGAAAFALNAHDWAAGLAAAAADPSIK